ncbi:MAG: Crp/Fnr family transcriptional regulator, partial [Bacteroidetes bacterium]|nr:Crp/Fnr family transcriptional regulator [Bacteroidota bacterium]
YNNRDLILQIIKPGSLIGGPGVLVDNMHHFSVSAITDSTACFIDINEYKKSLNNNTEFAIASLKEINSQHIENFNKFISLTQKQMQGRIADAIIYLSDEIFNSNSYDMTISRQDLADLTAMSKESAIRILKEFKDDKIIQLNHNKIEILNVDKLRRFSEIG